MLFCDAYTSELIYYASVLHDTWEHMPWLSKFSVEKLILWCSLSSYLWALSAHECQLEIRGFACISEVNGVYEQMGIAADGRPWFQLRGADSTWLFYDSACGPHRDHGWIVQVGSRYAWSPYEVDPSRSFDLMSSCNAEVKGCCSLARIEIDSQVPPAGTHTVREYCGHPWRRHTESRYRMVTINVKGASGHCIHKDGHGAIVSPTRGTSDANGTFVSGGGEGGGAGLLLFLVIFGIALIVVGGGGFCLFLLNQCKAVPVPTPVGRAVTVTVPDGAQPGQALTVQAPGFSAVEVIVPNDLVPGQTFRVHITPVEVVGSPVNEGMASIPSGLSSVGSPVGESVLGRPADPQEI